MKPLYGYLLLSVLVIGGLMLAFGPAFYQPHQYLFSHAGDGYKAYYATEYVLRHQEQSTWHHQFQYPFGNHALYMDINPLVTGVMRLLLTGEELGPQVIGTLNSLVIWGFLPCAWLLFGLFRRCHMPAGLALLLAAVVTFLSPQINRMTGHLSLAMLWFVPLMWAMTVRIFTPSLYKQALWFGLYGAVLSLCAFMHPYYALLGAAWLMLYALIYHWQQRSSTRLMLRQLGASLLTVGVPIGLLRLWEMSTQQGAQDFVTSPFGLLFYRAGPETLFLPMHQPFSDVWNFFFKVRSMPDEGYAYIGLAGTLILLSTLVRVGELIRQRQGKRILRPVLPDALRTSIWVGTILLIPAMAYPMLLWPDMVEYLGPLGQFRSLGRLAWLFFYPFMGFAGWWLYALFRALGRQGPQTQLKRIGAGLIALALFSWLINAAALVHSQRREILANHVSKFPEHNPDYQVILQQKGYSVDDFQAILALPAFHIGSEKFFTPTPGFWGERAAIAVSTQTGLSICNNMAARSPLTPSLKTIQLGAHPLIAKELPKEFPNQKPLLLVWIEASYTTGAQALIAAGREIATVGNIRLARLDLTAFEANDREQALARYDTIQTRWTQQGPMLLAQPSAPVIWESFGPDEDPLGKGTGRTPLRGEATIWRGVLEGGKAGDLVDLSFWLRVDPQRNYLPRGYIRQYVDGREIDKFSIETSNTQDIQGQWARVGWTLPLKVDNVELDIMLIDQEVVYDQLLIRPAQTDVYINPKEANWLLLNNYPLLADDWGRKIVP